MGAGRLIDGSLLLGTFLNRSCSICGFAVARGMPGTLCVAGDEGVGSLQDHGVGIEELSRHCAAGVSHMYRRLLVPGPEGRIFTPPITSWKRSSRR